MSLYAGHEYLASNVAAVGNGANIRIFVDGALVGTGGLSTAPMEIPRFHSTSAEEEIRCGEREWEFF